MMGQGAPPPFLPPFPPPVSGHPCLRLSLAWPGEDFPVLGAGQLLPPPGTHRAGAHLARSCRRMGPGF